MPSPSRAAPRCSNATHSSTLPHPQSWKGVSPDANVVVREPTRQKTIIGNATGDAPASEAGGHQIATHLNAHSFTRHHATKDRFVDQVQT